MFTFGLPSRPSADCDPLYGLVEFLASPQYMPIGIVANEQSRHARTSTRIGTSSQISNTQTLFGGPTIELTGSSSGFSYSSSPTTYPIDTSICLEAWIYPTSFLDQQNIFGAVDAIGGIGGFNLLTSDAFSARRWILRPEGPLNNVNLSIGQWYHIAVTNKGIASAGTRIMRYFVNGVLDTILTRNVFSAATSISPYVIGEFSSPPGLNPYTQFKGHIGGIRFTVGSARYSDSGFTPPTAPFPTC